MCRAPARTAAKELGYCIIGIIVGMNAKDFFPGKPYSITFETMEEISSGNVPPFVSQRTTHLAPASSAVKIVFSA